MQCLYQQREDLEAANIVVLAEEGLGGKANSKGTISGFLCLSVFIITPVELAKI
jgi:hypothetical protein